MTVTSTEDPRKSYDGNDVATEFEIVYPYDETADIIVEHIDDTTGVTTSFTENGAGWTGYTVNTTTNKIICNTAPATGTRLVHYRETEITQETALRTGRNYANEVVMDMCDKLTRVAQELEESIGRCLNFSETIESGWDYELPTPVDGAMLQWDTTNKQIVNASSISDTITVSTYMRTLLDETSEVNFRTAGNLQHWDFYTDTGAANAYVCTHATVMASLEDGTVCAFLPTNDNTGASTLNLDSLGVKSIVRPDGSALIAGDIQTTSVCVVRYRSGTGDFELVSTGLVAPGSRGSIDGLSLSNDTDADHDIQIAAGECRDSTNTVTLSLSAALTKQIDANWAEGDDAGGFPSGLSLAADTWYHVFLIGKTDGTVDAGFDTNDDASELLNDASDYTYYRRIRSVLTDGSSNILGDLQFGDLVLWKDPPLDLNGVSPGVDTNASYTISTPLGVRTVAHFNITAAADNTYYLKTPDVNDEQPSITVAPLANFSWTTSKQGMAMRLITNESSQIDIRALLNNATYLATTGYEDFRGKDV